MKERPILFSAPMVRALLAGRKTQTRRIINPQPVVSALVLQKAGGEPWKEGETLSQHVNEAWQSGFVDVDCPYGRPGDRLWVKEMWAWYPDEDGPDIVYRSDDGPEEVERWRPSIFMARHQSRVDLEVTAVRVEQVPDISERDAQAEGAPEWSGLPQFSPTCYREWYRLLWDDINRERAPWASNPWVWVVEFRVVRPC